MLPGAQFDHALGEPGGRCRGGRVAVLGEQPQGERLEGVPTRIASASPNTVHTVGRWRRVVSRSITSSWTSVKLWTSSTAAAARRAAVRAAEPPSAEAAASTRGGAERFPEPPPAGVPSAFCQPKW